MFFSLNTKESIKTALAMTIAYGIALQMDWDNPYWAGFAVAFISLSTVGQSLNKGAMRMLGTLIAVIVALTLIALFPQDRWLFMIFLSTYVGFCTYMMGGTKQQYFWNVCGFVCVIICMDAGPNSNNAFNTAVLRAQETGLGILVYSLVSFLLWPNNSSDNFDAAVKKLAIAQHNLYQLYLGVMRGRSDATKEQTLKTQIAQEQVLFDQLLDAAETDTYDVWELRQQWRHYQRQVVKLTETIEHWHESIIDLAGVDMSTLLPNLTEFGTELDNRLEQIIAMLNDRAPNKQPAVIELALDDSDLGALSHFHKAALAVNRSQLELLEQITRSLFNTISDIKGFSHTVEMVDKIPLARSFFVLDTDRVASVIRIMVIMWLSYLMLIYVDSIPGGTSFVTAATVLGMAMVTMPQASVTILFLPVAVSVLFAAAIYIFLLPQLTNFFELGLLIFAVTFTICYLFEKPNQALGKTFGLAMFALITSISNEQTYSFLVVANTALIFPLVFFVLAITEHIPFSTRPEHAFLRLLGRFFNNCEYLISNLPKNRLQPVTGMNRWINNTRAQELVALSKKLGIWAKHIDTNRLPGTTIGQVQSIVTSMQTLAFRIHDLLEIRSRPQVDILLKELSDDALAWRNILVQTFQNFSKDATVGKGEAFRIKLKEIMNHIEKRIQEVLDKIDEGQITAAERENFYRLLGAYRSVSEAMVDYAEKSEVIDWNYWREERFA